MTDRESHRAAVDAGYASLAEYIKKWGDDKMDDLLKRLRSADFIHDRFVNPDGPEAADEIERLRGILQRVIRLIGNSEDAFYYAKSAAQEAFQQKDSE